MDVIAFEVRWMIWWLDGLAGFSGCMGWLDGGGFMGWLDGVVGWGGGRG